MFSLGHSALSAGFHDVEGQEVQLLSYIVSTSLLAVIALLGWLSLGFNQERPISSVKFRSNRTFWSGTCLMISIDIIQDEGLVCAVI